MKQILQSLKNGLTEVAEVACPMPGHGQLLVRTSRSLVSVGTERMLVDFGRASLVGKSLRQPEKVRQVLHKARTDGLAPTLEAVLNKLDQPHPLGYCNVGTVVEAGVGVTGFKAGDRVASNGWHAETVVVASNLCAKIPDSVTDDEAAFTVPGAIALQGIRLAQPTLGEVVVVTGLGLIGLMTVQLLRAHGCRVLGLDFDPLRLQLAERFGAETVNLSSGADPLASALSFSRGRGVDAVIITASATSNEPMHQAAQMCRRRGRIVLVGVTGLTLSRADFYEKELSFQVSCSYGPGRHDPNYEDKGQDYPASFVRWTAQRNFEAVLDMLGDDRLDVSPLISHHFPVADAPKAYELLTSTRPSLGILVDYPQSASAETLKRTVILRHAPVPHRHSGIGFIGSGNYATAVLIPAFKATGSRLVSVASRSGVSSLHAARKFGFEKTSTDVDALLSDPDIDAVVIATRHDTHCALVCRAIGAGKHVFVEKPLALSKEELARIGSVREEAIAGGFSPIIMVGFNRRFAPHAKQVRSLLEGVSAPKAFVVTVNAGAIPPNHWVQDREIGGGRIIGEACHFVDLLRYLAHAPITSYHTQTMADGSGDTATITLSFADGSLGTIHYFANGSRRVSKERLEVFCAGRILQLDNFRSLSAYGWPRFRKMGLWRQDKGQRACAEAFARAVDHGGPSPIPFEELVEISETTLEVATAAKA